MSESWLADWRQPRDSLATKIIFFVFLSTFVTSLVVSWIAVHSTYSFVRSHLEQLYPASLRHAADALDRSRRDAERRLAQIARQPELLAAATSGGSADLERLLREALAGDPLVTRLVLRDAQGAVRASAGEDPAPAPVPHRTPGGVGASVRAEGARLVASVPFRDATGTPAGRLEGWLPPAAALLHLDGATALGLVHVADAAGTVVARGSAGANGKGFDAFPPEVLASDAPAAELVEFRDGAGRRAIATALPLAAAGWTLVAAQPVERAYAPVFAVVTRIFVIDLAVVLLFSFLAYEITSAIVRPLEQLSDAARRISQGDLEVEIANYRRRDEIGLLTRTFNDMARRLHRNRAEIDQQHRQLREQNEQLQQANEVLEQLSITDGLTKLHNHRYFQEMLTREIKRVSRTGETLAMLLIDIDDFKALNDRLGHAAGDAVLVRIARILNESVRESDLLARYGGEEFVVLATGTDLEGGVYVAEKVRTAVAEASFGIDPSGEPMRVTVSIGVAQFQGDRRGFFDSADRALYRAKGAGKNCVVSADEPGGLRA